MKKFMIIIICFALLPIVSGCIKKTDAENKKEYNYIGEMTAARILPNITKINNNSILISGGYTKVVEHQNLKKGPFIKKKYFKEESQEIYNPKTKKFKKINKKINAENKINMFDDLYDFEEKYKVENYLKNNKIDFDNIKFKKINKEKILCIPDKRKYKTPFIQNYIVKNLFIYDLKNKKIENKYTFDKELNNLQAISVKTGETIKFLLIYEYEISEKNVYFQIAIYNPETNIIEKEYNPDKDEKFNYYNIIKFENSNILITKNNNIKYLFDSKTLSLKNIENDKFQLKEGSSIFQLNDNQLLIIGGYTKKPYVTMIKCEKLVGIPCNTVEKNAINSAYIYTF